MPSNLPYYKIRMPKIGLSQFEMFYESRGTNEPLVLIPGFASGAWSWAWQVDDLSHDFRVITFDPRGISNSPAGDDVTVSIESIADDIAELLEKLEINRSHILGVSFGGFVAQEFALKFPEKLGKLILASTSFGGLNHIAPSMEVLSAFASTVGLNSAERIRKYLTLAFSLDFVKNNCATVEKFCRLREKNTVPERVYLQQLQSAVMFNAESRLPDIMAEVLVISGESDNVVPMQNSENLAKIVPTARLEIIKGVGHMAFVEFAGKFNEIVKDFLLP